MNNDESQALLNHFSPSCERNKVPILNQLEKLLNKASTVLEIGSYSGQHGLFFTEHLPHITWQTSDTKHYLAGLEENIIEFGNSNCLAPIELDVNCKKHWPNSRFDVIFTANTLHIMSWQHVIALFENIGPVAKAGSLFIAYGPFNYNGQFSSESNAEFELWLKARDSESGIRDFERVNQLAMEAGFELVVDQTMPANNQLLTWRYQ